MINGLNHITVAVSDIEHSLQFYCNTLGFIGHVKWNNGAYLSCGDIWLCLSLDKPVPSQDYSHIAWNVAAEDFGALVDKLRQVGAETWKDNTSEGNSLYFLDPDGHRLEIHVGGLEQRLLSLKRSPYKGLQWL